MLVERKIEGHFVTLSYVLWEPKTRAMRFANAGMPLPVLVRHGRSKVVRAEGVPLGLLEHIEYQETPLTLEKGDLLAFFSDGLVEAADPNHEEFGARRLESILREHAAKPIGEILKVIFDEIARFEQGHQRRDDQTLLLIRVK
jgi:sigma-B regulation protein RsbU (phosphoserine phosphatase)